ncbi:MAG: DUF4867 family protein [Dorea sp.]|nr:DUF4867 family protein [Dorea sp.]
MEIKVKHLTKEEFAEYGQFNDMLDSGRAGFGTEAFTFYRDCVRYATQAPVLGMSTLSVKKDERFQLQALEYHNYASEVMMPMDDDAVLFLAKAGSSEEPSENEVEAFIVPKNVIVHLNPGVWHYMPLPLHNSEVNVLIVLPERVYHNDLFSVDMSAKEISVTI